MQQTSNRFAATHLAEHLMAAAAPAPPAAGSGLQRDASDVEPVAVGCVESLPRHDADAIQWFETV